jgi:ribonuclease Z
LRATFHPFLPNGLTGDPVVWVDLIDEDHSLLVDLGDLRAMPNRKLLRVRRVVVSHTHLDHFFGFDQLLRLSMTRERELTLTGPRGFVDNVEGKLRGYTWNLIGDYPIRLRVEEIDEARIRSTVYRGTEGLRPERQPDRGFEGTIYEGPSYAIDSAVLDHGTPVLGVVLREHEHLAVNRDRLDALGLEPGAWLKALKDAVRAGRPDTDEVCAPTLEGGTRRYELGQISGELILRQAGQRIGYLSDLRPDPQNLERAVDLVRGAQLLICETAFLHRDEQLARERNHLTARRAGELAREAGVQRLAPFHVSSRYEGCEEQLLEEAAAAFGGPVVRLPAGPVAG